MERVDAPDVIYCFSRRGEERTGERKRVTHEIEREERYVSAFRQNVSDLFVKLF